ncbi:MAG: hypothetical protein MJD61_09055, partial [Proteobacteria bacterium]|nr:hypothetical protein [Pseudomonadota bacterium]
MKDMLLEALQAVRPRHKRFELQAVWQAYARAWPAAAEGADARRNLRRALELLAQHGKLTLPKQASRWDHSAQPALPRFVVLTTAARKPAPARQHVAWAPELSFARELRSPQQRDLLLCVQRFLASGGRTRPLVPERERSLQLFGDEKRLEKLRRTPLFSPCRLSLGL